MALGDFVDQAQAYAARPGYPPALLDRLLARAGVVAGDTVADLGAGTGIFTALLAARGLRVLAVEPSAPMRAAAPDLPGVTWHDGTFEAPGLAAGAVRWITAAQAFHWADPPRALPALAAALADGGHLTCLWNDRRNHDSAVLRDVVALVRREVPGFDEHYRDRAWSEVLAGRWFEPPVLDEERHTVVMTRARFVALWQSHNRLAEAAGPALPGLIAAIADRVADLATVEVPYLTRAFTARARR